MGKLNRYNGHELELIQEVVDVVEGWLESPWFMHEEFADLMDFLCSCCKENTDAVGTYRVLRRGTPWLLASFVTDLLEPLIVYQAVAKSPLIDPEVLENLAEILHSWNTNETSRKLEDALGKLDHAITRLAIFAVVTAPLDTKERKRAPRKRSRDLQFQIWREQGMGPAAIRDRWNRENPQQKIGPKTQGTEVVKQALRRLKTRKQG